MVSTPMLTTIWRQRWIRTVVCWVSNRSPADEAGFEELLAWLVGFGELGSWARRSQLESFIHLAKRSPNTAKRSTPSSTMVSPRDPSNRLTPEIRLLTRITFAFHGPGPSSPSHYSLSAVTHHDSQAENDPRIQQKSALCSPSR